ncbi:SusD/RagB family nutrient-binding outer membrane lipoprotein [Rhizosphaericola mali]|uniref:SusD/RagB family nutrient-binding outer membrane lipoprotein n=1 Tax=Rhizosphaericola mali TaxID=2545455 RepID=A0A5P2G336_9BACT|nr:SusD/RagB family nutrient-binding outer membrane lipoprotein [Rhizosphaericola mali]QES89128.1 SusD/RagB family nutrient-binding outer membrane lipoprotein [Rhizosphaericola mali]
MKLYNSGFLVSVFALILIGCSKYLDVNSNPNQPTDVPEKEILAPLELSITTSLSGGPDAVNTNEWMQIMTPNQTAPNSATYYVLTSTFDGYWYTYYTTIMNNLYLLNLKADADGNDVYAGISKVLMAYSLGNATDLWGDIPYTQAFLGVNQSNPKYDSQESIYDSLHVLLDSAIVQLTSAGGQSVGSEDYFYSGDATKWIKFAYTLKARNYMHLINASGYTKNTQAQLALAALDNGMVDYNDDCKYTYDGSTAISSWSQYFTQTATEVMSSHIVDTLKNTNDPRLSYLIAKSGEDKDGSYVGLLIGSTPATSYYAISELGDFYGAKSSSGYVMAADEAIFLKAEAELYVDGYASAQSYYYNGIVNNFLKMGIDTTGTSAQAYLKNYGTLESSTALAQIMYQKSIANFLSLENFTDWRRTGYPVLNVVNNAYSSSIPRRFYYPYTELTENTNTPKNVKLSDRVWWDAN